MVDKRSREYLQKLETIQISRRGFLRVAAGATATVIASGALSGCGGTTITTTGAGVEETYDGGIFDAGGATLTLMDWGGPWEENSRTIFLNQFEKDFNCTVMYDPGFPWYPKFAASTVDNPPADLVNANKIDTYKLSVEGYLLDRDEVIANVPNTADCWDFALKQGYGIIRYWDKLGLAYRKDLVDPAPTRWQDMWDEKFADKRGNYAIDHDFAASLFLLACTNWGKSQEYDIELGKTAYEALKPVKLADLSPLILEWLIAGEILVGNQQSGDPLSRESGGAPISWAQCEEGAPLVENDTCVTKGSKQKKLAYALLNRMLDPENQSAFIGWVGMRPANKKAKMPAFLEAIGVTNSTSEVETLWFADWPWYWEHADELLEWFNTMMAE
jgi:putative spermidine/putrescine transport system substrate-binding protein